MGVSTFSAGQHRPTDARHLARVSYLQRQPGRLPPSHNRLHDVRREQRQAHDPADVGAVDTSEFSDDASELRPLLL